MFSHHEYIQQLVGKKDFKRLCFDTHTQSYLQIEDGTELTPKNVINTNLVLPRCKQPKGKQNKSTSTLGEIYTPAEITNYQNSIYVNNWFGRNDVFTKINPDLSYDPTKDKITFPDGKCWLDFVQLDEMEACCGEAPYLIGLHDVNTFEKTPIDRAVGLLALKLRVVCENTRYKREWFEAALVALETTRAYDIKPESVLLAREAAVELVDAVYKANFGEDLKIPQNMISAFCNVISHNFWVMDGITFTHPTTSNKCTIVDWRNGNILEVDGLAIVGNIFTDENDEIEIQQQSLTLDNPWYDSHWQWLYQSNTSPELYSINNTGSPYSYTFTKINYW